MIKNKEDLKYYLSEDAKRYNVRFIDRLLFNESYFVLKYLKNLRKLEYLTNIKKNPFQLFLYYYRFWNHKRMSYKYRLHIGINSCGPGLFIPHLGGITAVPSKAKVGAHCTINADVIIGNLYDFNKVATIGDNVELALGCKIIGKVKIGDNAKIAPNSVVVRNVPANASAFGVFAKNIKPDEI